MKRILLFTAGLTALAVAVLAQGEADYQTWMKTVGATSGSLRKNLTAKDAAAASADARKLQDVFAKVHDYWHAKNVDDAMMAAANASAGFRDVADLASAGKFAEASAAVQKTSATCGACHAAHREKAADGSWKIK